MIKMATSLTSCHLSVLYNRKKNLENEKVHFLKPGHSQRNNMIHSIEAFAFKTPTGKAQVTNNEHYSESFSSLQKMQSMSLCK